MDKMIKALSRNFPYLIALTFHWYNFVLLTPRKNLGNPSGF